MHLAHSRNFLLLQLSSDDILFAKKKKAQKKAH